MTIQNAITFPQTRKRIHTAYIFARLSFSYALLYAFFFITGLVMFHTYGSLNETATLSTAFYFRNIFADCTAPPDFMDALMTFCKSDIRHLVLIFIFGFTMFSRLASAVLISYRGLAFGYSVCYLTEALRQGEVVLHFRLLSFTMFLIIGALVAASLIYMCVKTAFFSSEFKRLCGSPRLIIKSRALYSQIFRLLVILGFILIARCVSALVNLI